MLIEAPQRLRLVTADQENPSGFSDDVEQLDRDYDCQPISRWDEVAERWPNGGRFPSFIFLDQSA